MNWRIPFIHLLLSFTQKKLLDNLKEIERVVCLSSEEICSYQKQRISSLLSHAYQRVPYYRKILADYGVVVNGAVHLDQFSHLPVLTKEIIRLHYNELKSSDLKSRKWFCNSSGGSSGEPVSFIQDQDYLAWNIAYKLFIKKYGGHNPGERELRLWGSERDVLEGKEKISIRLRNWLYNRKDLNTFSISYQKYDRFILDWNTYTPGWVEAYVQSIYDFANYLDINGLVVTPPRGIVTSAGTLYEDVKKKLEEVFRCKIYNRYGSREVGDMACSCKTSAKLHLAPWSHYFEILNDALQPVTQGEMGGVYVTLLTNYAMPLIRYKIGDIAVPANAAICSCGINTPVIAKVIGREVHIFKTKTGEKIDGEYFTHLFYHKNWVKKFQVVQKEYDYIEIKIVGNKSPEDQSEIEKAVRIVMGDDCEIKWFFVEKIDLLKSGKFLYTISEV